MTTLETLLVLYGVLAIGHLIVQTVLGHLEFRRERRLPFDPEWHPSVTVIVPVYNEDTGLLQRCLRSIERQDYPDLETLVVDDGSMSRNELLEVLEEYAGGQFRVLLKRENQGKRRSQAEVLDRARGEIIVTVDSDTSLEPDAVSYIVQRFKECGVAAVTGDVRVANRRTNLLTRLIGYRYWSAFHQERAAQSLFGVMMCCSGPFSAYRRDVVERVKDAYIGQTFLGRICTVGDDRHLTNLVLAAGYRTVFDQRATAWTQVPKTIPVYVRQQTRWNKSFYRELLWTARFAYRRHPYLSLDLAFQTLLPFMLVGALGAMVYQAVAIDLGHLWQYLAILVGIGLLRSLYGIVRTRDPGFLTFICYGVLHVTLLIPVRLYSLATLRRTHWGTRSAAA
jgi:hyaluronan synthase/N-acetylglucosaminyltransferase